MQPYRFKTYIAEISDLKCATAQIPFVPVIMSIDIFLDKMHWRRGACIDFLNLVMTRQEGVDTTATRMITLLREFQ
jgi:hypothetical protein